MDYQTLTDQDLRDKATGYDAMHNDGHSDSYNPYSEELERRMEAQIASLDNTPEQRREALRTERRTLSSSEARESGLYDTAKIAEIDEQIKEIDAQLEAETWSEWTLDATQARRTEWNAKSRNGELGDAQSIAQAQRDLGWTITDLKTAIAHHSI